VNGHFDSPLGSPGAADCGSCVASMLELSRLIIDSGAHMVLLRHIHGTAQSVLSLILKLLEVGVQI
jgi:Zn-dependent M28 family amino/carboxypeptidase